jgi:hypothetical protein
MGSEPSRDDDPTGVRELLSSLAAPDPMPDHLVERINASLAAEQAQRAATMSGASVTPLLASARRRPARLVFAVAGAAAAIALVAVVSSSLFTMSQPISVTGGAALASTSSARELSSGAPPNAAAKAPRLSGSALSASAITIRHSGARYTRADFVTQARTLRTATFSQPQLEDASAFGPAATTPGLMECLRAIGAAEAQVVRADVGFYEGRPAVIIVTTTNGIPMAYVVGSQCSQADAAVLRPATPLP